MSTAALQSPVLSVTEICQMLSVSRTLVLKMIKRGELPAYQRGRLIRVLRSEVDRVFQFGNGTSLLQEANASRAESEKAAV